MADITFAQIEAGLVTRIDAQLPYLEQCYSYAGELDAIDPIIAPAAFVLFDGLRVDGASVKGRQCTASFSVLVVGDSYVGGSLPRTDTYGAYSLVQAVITAVDDHALGITDFAGCTLTGVDQVRVDKLRAIYRVRFDAFIEITR